MKYLNTSSKKHFEVLSDFISSQFTRQCPLGIPTQPTLHPCYTSSPDIPHQDSYSNEELKGVTLEEPLYIIPKIEVNQLHHHTRAYLKSLCQIPIIYEIWIYQVSQRRTQPYGDGETLKYRIDDIIIDKIYGICHPIIDIAHSNTFEDPKLWNLMYF